MRMHSQRGSKSTKSQNHLFDDDIPIKKTNKTERKAEKRKSNQRFQNLIKQGIYDIDEDMD